MPGPSTTAVHAGAKPDARTGAVTTPVHHAATFLYPELPDGSPAPYIYSRYTNPSLEAVETAIAALEGADGALLFASGLGAATAALMSHLKPGDTLAVQQGIYGGTRSLMDSEFVPRGIKVHDLGAVDPAGIPKGTRLVWMESITNPMLRVADVKVWADAAHAAGAKLLVDASFATPILQRPLALGADVVMHSATKYLGGHSDLIAGALAFGEAERDALWTRRRNLGATLDAGAAYLLGRGVKTLALRVERHCQNAKRIARDLEAAGVVVHHPGLAGHPDHKTASRVLAAPGGMITIDLGSKEAAQRFRRRLKLILPAASLGGVESLASLPLETSHAYASAEARRREGVTDGLVRISIGIEDAEDLLADIQQAMA